MSVQDDTMLVFAGVDATWLLLSDLWSLNLTTRSWRELRAAVVGGCSRDPALPGARQRHSATMSGAGSMYVFGGIDARGQFLSYLWRCTT